MATAHKIMSTPPEESWSSNSHYPQHSRTRDEQNGNSNSRRVKKKTRRVEKMNRVWLLEIGNNQNKEIKAKTKKNLELVSSRKQVFDGSRRGAGVLIRPAPMEK